MTPGPMDTPAETPNYRAILDRVVAGLPASWGAVEALGGYTLADLLAALNKVGIGPEDVEICGNGKNYGLELWLVRPDDFGDDDDDDDPEQDPSPGPTRSHSPKPGGDA